MATFRKSARLHHQMQVQVTKGRFSRDQKDFMEEYFHEENYPNLLQRTEIADLIGLHQNQVSIWFANRRKKFKDETERESQTIKVPRKCISSSSVSRDRTKKTNALKQSASRCIPKTDQPNLLERNNDGEELEWFLREIPVLKLDTLPWLPTWPTPLKHIPFQQKLFEEPKEKQSEKEETQNGKKAKRGKKKAETTSVQNAKIDNPDELLSNSQILKNLDATIEVIRQDSLYVPVVDELSSSSEYFLPVDVEPSQEESLVRSVKHFMEPSSCIQYLKL